MSVIDDAKALIKEIDDYEQEHDPWRDKAEAFDFLEMFHERMYKTIEELINGSAK
jgi:hypothetical protein